MRTGRHWRRDEGGRGSAGPPHVRCDPGGSRARLQRGRLSVGRQRRQERTAIRQMAPRTRAGRSQDELAAWLTVPSSLGLLHLNL